MKRKLITILWKSFYAVFMLFTGVGLLFVFPFKPFLSIQKYRYLVYRIARFWGRVTVLSTGSRVQIEGLELIPDNANLCFIGNHQGLFDIPSFIGYIGRPAGFIAKKELFRIPVLSHWMRQMPCVFIDRENARKAIESFQTSAEIIKQGLPLVIFPEGGRSFGDDMGKFHLGSLKLPQIADATIVPFAIKGTWRIMEIDKNIHAIKVKIKILPPITPDNPVYHDKIALANSIHNQIELSLKEM